MLVWLYNDVVQFTQILIRIYTFPLVCCIIHVHGTCMHYVGGQKQATQVSKLIQTCTQKIKKLLVQYNQIQSQNGDDSQASVKDVCDLGS